MPTCRLEAETASKRGPTLPQDEPLGSLTGYSMAVFPDARRYIQPAARPRREGDQTQRDSESQRGRRHPIPPPTTGSALQPPPALPPACPLLLRSAFDAPTAGPLRVRGGGGKGVAPRVSLRDDLHQRKFSFHFSDVGRNFDFVFVKAVAVSCFLWIGDVRCWRWGKWR